MGSASLNGAEDRQKTGVLCMCMCALSFRRHPTISSVIPMEDTRAIVLRRPPIEAVWGASPIPAAQPVALLARLAQEFSCADYGISISVGFL